MLKFLPFIFTFMLITARSEAKLSESVHPSEKIMVGSASSPHPDGEAFIAGKTEIGRTIGLSGPTEADNVTALPDIMFTNVNVDPIGVLYGQKLTATYGVKNIGSTAATLTAVSVLLSTDTIADQSDKLLGVGSGFTLGPGIATARTFSTVFDTSYTDNIYYLLFIIDKANEVNEADENNNFQYVKFSIGGPVDVLHSKSGYSTFIEPGKPLVISLESTNSGKETAPPTTTRFYLSTDKILDSRDGLMPEIYELDSIHPAEKKSSIITLHIPDSLKPGEYYIIYSYDHYRKVPESNEFNNLFANRFVVELPTGTLGSEAGSEFQAYPNPASGIINVTGIKSVEKGGISASLLDVHGNLISENVLTSIPGRLDISEFSGGVYFLRIISENETSVIKIFRQ